MVKGADNTMLHEMVYTGTIRHARIVATNAKTKEGFVAKQFLKINVEVLSTRNVFVMVPLDAITAVCISSLVKEFVGKTVYVACFHQESKRSPNTLVPFYMIGDRAYLDNRLAIHRRNRKMKEGIKT